MESLPILEHSRIEGALRRFVRANGLFEQACCTVLESEGQETPAVRVLDAAEAALLEASKELESALEQLITQRVEEALQVARLLETCSAPHTVGSGRRLVGRQDV